jgi:hypothetical protein
VQTIYGKLGNLDMQASFLQRGLGLSFWMAGGRVVEVVSVVVVDYLTTREISSTPPLFFEIRVSMSTNVWSEY